MTPIHLAISCSFQYYGFSKSAFLAYHPKVLMSTITTYITESLAELHQVRWPTQQQAIRLTTIVVIFIAVTAVIFGAIDALFTQIISFTLKV